MNDVHSALEEIEASLPRGLPEDYRTFLVNPCNPSSNLFLPYHPRHVDAQYGLSTVFQIFRKEWHPLHGALFPVEYLGEGCQACLHLLNPRTPEPPVIFWDTTKDLAEQLALPLASSWSEYIALRSSGFEPLYELAGELRDRQWRATKQLARSIDQFNRFSDWFQKDYERRQQGKQFDHQSENRMPRYDEWRPQRFCVHDHLLGVMGYRFNRLLGRIEVVGFATKDHTNYARGTATKALLLNLLCEWAKQSCQEGIVFVEDWQAEKPALRAVPAEILLYASLLGVDVDHSAPTLSHQVCRDLLLALTPFRVDTKDALKTEGIGTQASLAVHQGVWTVTQIEDLLRYCPRPRELFGGTVTIEEQVRMAVYLEHARSAVVIGMTEQLMQVQAEEHDQSVSMQQGSADSEDFLQDFAYSRVFQCGFEVKLKCFTPSGVQTVGFEPDRPLLAFVWPARRQDVERHIPVTVERLRATLESMGLAGSTSLLFVPETSLVGAKGASQVLGDSGNVSLVLLNQSFEEIDTTALRCLDQTRRLRR